MPLATTVTSATLATRIGVNDSDQVQRALDTALELLDTALESAFRPVPQSTLDECVLSVGQAVWDRRKTGNSSGGQLTTVEGQAAARTPRDPLASVRHLLALYVVPL